MLKGKLEQDVDRTTIYRILNRFDEDGIVHKVICDDGKQYFAYSGSREVNGKDHDHFHFRCRSCGKVECLSEKIEVDLPNGYEPEAFNGVVSGYCNNCLNSR